MKSKRFTAAISVIVVRRKISSVLFALLVIWTILPSTLLSQSDIFDDRWRWVQFTTESGLPSNDVVALAEATDGTPWVATERGLAWYDGYQWHRIDSTHGLPMSAPDRMVCDLRGGLLLIYSNGNLYQGNQQGFRQIPLRNVSYAVPLSRDTLAILTTDELVCYCAGHVGKFSPSPNIEAQFPSGLYRTERGSIWLRKREGYYQLEKSVWKLRLNRNPSIHTPIALAENKKGNGILALENPSELWEWSAHAPISETVDERWQFVKAATITSLNEIILVAASDELRLSGPKGWLTINPSRTGVHDISCVSSRENGDLWFGTKNGLYYFKRTSERWSHLQYGPPFGRDLINDVIKARDGSLWIATGDGIVLQTPSGGSKFFAELNGHTLHAVTGVAEDEEGNVWISSGSSFSGAYKWDGSRWKFYAVSTDGKEIYVHKIHKDRRGRLWFLGLNPSPLPEKQPGAYVLEGDTFNRWSTAEGLLNDRVYAFGEDSKGGYWFGTVGGVSRYRNGKWWYWKSEGVFPGRVFTLDIDKDDRVWFSDGMARLLTIDPDDSVRSVELKPHSGNGRIMDISFDADGRLWLATLNGLELLDKGVWTEFDYKTGLVSPVIWPVRSIGNTLYVGTIGKGMAILDIGESTLPFPRVIVDVPRVEVGGAFLRWKALAYWGKQASEDITVRYRLNGEGWSEWNTIREVSFTDLSPGTHSFEIEAKDLFAGVSHSVGPTFFVVPRPIINQPVFIVSTATLSFIAIGLIINQIVRRRRHVRMIRESEAKFRRLAEATFEGIIIHEKGKILDTNASISAILGRSANELLGTRFVEYVVPDFRETMEAIWSGTREGPHEVLLFRRDGASVDVEIISKFLPSQERSLGVMAIRDISERKAAERTLVEYQEQLRSLASTVASTESRERQRMATYLHDTIGQSLAFCKIRLGDLREPIRKDQLGEIRKIIEEAIQSTQSLTFDLSPSILSELSFKDAVESLVEQMEEKYDILITFEDDKQPKIVAEDLQRFLYRAIRELIVNAVKHGSAHSAEVYLRMAGRLLQVEVSDDGNGIKQNGARASAASGGFGLFSIRESIRHFGGTLETHSIPEGGTRALLSVPIMLTEVESRL